MVAVAGPSGSGKSRYFPVSSFGCDGFNVDHHAAAANGGSFRGIPPEVRGRSQRACEAFILDHIARRESFAVETTLRTGIAVDQARQAQAAGFQTTMIFVTAGSADACVLRVRLRGLAGGHAAPELQIRDIHARSMANLALACEVFDRVELFENAVWMGAPRLVARVIARRLEALVEPLPEWVSRCTLGDGGWHERAEEGEAR